METAVQKSPAPTTATVFPLRVRLRPVLDLSEDQFFELCGVNRELRIERNAEGELLIMPPTGSETGSQNAEITMQVALWAKQNGTGIAFDSSVGFTLPNGAVRSPDASWLPRARWEQLGPEQRRKFAPVCPDFVLELRAPTDALPDVQDKMREYIAHGAKLGWLVDPILGQLHVYRPGAPVAILERPDQISGDPELPGLVLDLREIW